MRNFGAKIRRKEATCKTKLEWERGSKIDNNN